MAPTARQISAATPVRRCAAPMPQELDARTDSASCDSVEVRKPCTCLAVKVQQFAYGSVLIRAKAGELSCLENAAQIDITRMLAFAAGVLRH